MLAISMHFSKILVDPLLQKTFNLSLEIYGNNIRYINVNSSEYELNSLLEMAFQICYINFYLLSL